VELLAQFDVLVRSAGISPYRAELEQLRSRGVQFTTASSLWFAENPGAQTICITGTKGKSTTAALITHLLNWAGVKACLSGNIGRPMLACDDNDVDWWVIELSSYQISDLEAAPDYAMILNLSDEHIDWHGGSTRYRADKLRLAKLTGEKGLIVNAADTVLAKSFDRFGGVNWFNAGSGWNAGFDRVDKRQADSGKVVREVRGPASLPGEHNMHNLAAVLTLLDELEIEILDLDQALAAFSGLPHRLQTIGEKNGVRYVDDSISTTPVSVAAALETLGTDGVILLLGGLDRGLDWDEFARGLAAHPPLAIITMPDNGAKVYAALQAAAVDPAAGLHTVDDLSEAVKLAQSLAPENGCILLSPGAPSFPHFRDFEDRGNQFAAFAGIEKSVLGTH
jgi:UDP-N-acetylmuramoylalanine--D-glutamate ligase